MSGHGLAAAALAAGDAACPHRAELARIAAERAVVTRPPAPSLRDYLAHLASRAGEALEAWLRGLHWDPAAVLPALELAGRLLAAALLIAAAWLLARALAARLRARGTRPTAGPPPPLAEAAPRAHPPSWWRSRLEAALAAGDAAGALRALWMWTAVRLLADQPHPSWTSRDLLRRCGRPELEPLLARLDRWRFGPRRPSPEEVRRLASALEGAVP